jgi:hypothetical protein
MNDTPYRAFYADETLGWGAITRDLAVVDVDGGHSTILQEPFVDSIVTALIPYIKHNQPICSTRMRAAAEPALCVGAVGAGKLRMFKAAAVP